VGIAIAASALAGAVPAHARSSSGTVVYGYPYASRCPTAGYADAVDRWGMYMCNCTSYVAWTLHANHQRTDWFIRGAMDAWNWPHVARLAHLSVAARPRLRSVAVWPRAARPFGHVAYVIGVERDGRVDVSEYNDPNSTLFEPFTFDVRTDVPTTGAVFIYVPRSHTRHL
jgi:surface antigen